MAFTYHPPTTNKCTVCEKLLEENKQNPIIETVNGKASSTNGYPFHNWYNFVLGFTPIFPEYMLKREQISKNDVVLDPFNGSGTTQLVCKLHEISSIGVDANDFMVLAAKQKLNWEINKEQITNNINKVIKNAKKNISSINWEDKDYIHQRVLTLRVQMLDDRYISDKPFLKIILIREIIDKLKANKSIKEFLNFALSAILVPVSNIRYGPGFGVGKIKEDADVLEIYTYKLKEMMEDLKKVTQKQIDTESKTFLGDSRKLSQIVKENSISLIITSPPYPGDHEYTKHSKLELIFQNMATDIASFRTIKKRMLRSSTTNIYKTDNEKEAVSELKSIIEVTELIQERLTRDGATSGFEKLYTRLVWEYFGGMANTLEECFKVLKPGGKIALLVSDSHSFKMVHIQTAEILGEIGLKIGFVNPMTELWQMKNSTSHNYQLRENILILQKPTVC